MDIHLKRVPYLHRIDKLDVKGVGRLSNEIAQTYTQEGAFLINLLFLKNMTQVQQWEVRLLQTVDKMDWDMESWPPHESWEFIDLPWLVVVTLRSQELAFLCVPNSPLQILLVMFIRSSWQRKPTAVLHLAREKETLDPVSENIFIAFAVHFPTERQRCPPRAELRGWRGTWARHAVDFLGLTTRWLN